MRHFSNLSLKSLLLVLLLIGFAVALASAEQERGVSEVVYTFTGDALEGPEQLEAGFHTITLQNDGEVVADIDIVRLKGDNTPEDVIATFQEADRMAMEEGDFAAAIEAFLSVADLLGGRVAAPGMREGFGINLEPGRYAVVSRRQDYATAEVGYLVKPLEVVSAAEMVQPPQVELTVDMVDFAFAIPDEISAGTQVWEIVNRGEQVHHLSLMKLQPGRTVDDVMAFMATEEGEPPFDGVGYTSMLSSGSSNYVTFDLEPGAYLAACFVPDHRNGTGQPHFALGMIAAFTVIGE